MVIQNDLEQFGSKHDDFSKQPINELLYGWEIILNGIVHEQRYNEFTGPLVYNSAPPSWKEVKSLLKSLMKKILLKL